MVFKLQLSDVQIHDFIFSETICGGLGFGLSSQQTGQKKWKGLMSGRSGHVSAPS